MEVVLMCIVIQTVILAILAMQIHKLRMQFAFVPYPEEAQSTDEQDIPVDVIDVHDTQSAFDKRIAEFQVELNTPTYEDNVAQTLHPDVYNVPHDTVTDTPIRHEEEYAK